VDVNVFSESGDVKVEFLDTDIPERLLRRYDVTDFATPVNSVDVNTSQRGTSLTLKTTGDFDYLAYQTDNEYVVSIKPLTKKPRLRSVATSSTMSASVSRSTSRTSRCARYCS
jgi:type IV pilus assembly protein PilQ